MQVEAIFNAHPHVNRTALVGLGTRPDQRPILVVEMDAGHDPESAAERQKLIAELKELGVAHEHTRAVQEFIFHRQPFPVDVRHNVKIRREVLADWAAQQV